ncbi:ZSWM2 ligase, partial [Polyodon spathula]|nr:ZSWM2 ligase [Polyodon spathula]
MFRNTCWRRTINDLVSWHQDQALNTTIFILREFGPTGFLLKEEGETRNFKVCLGDPHCCTCSVFFKDKDLCKHICWVLLKKFRLPREHEYCFQLGLVEREINQLLWGLHHVKTPRPAANISESKQKTTEDDGCVGQKMIDAEDVCPICQEELLKKKLPVSYCRYGCGNSVHISCMKIWADHQTKSQSDTMVKCPLCRKNFASLKNLYEEVRNSAKLTTAAEKERPDRHLGIPCNNCTAFPINGKCFKCTVCCDYHLCEECFRKQCHSHHSFSFRLKRTQRWRPVSQLSSHSLMFTFLLCSDSSTSESLPENIVSMLPFLMVRQNSKLLEPGHQCRICLKTFILGQHVRQLPCHHKFHKKCIDHWLLQECNSCPLDGQVVYNTLTWNNMISKEKTKKTLLNHLRQEDQLQQELFIPGIGISIKRTGVTGGYSQPGRDKLQDQRGRSPGQIPQDMILNGLECLQLSGMPLKHDYRTSDDRLATGYQESPPEVSIGKQNCYSSGSIKTEHVSERSAISADTSVRIINRAYNEKHALVESTRISAVRGRPKSHLSGSAVCPESPENVFVGLNVLSKDCMVQGREVCHPGRATSHRRVNYRRPRYNSVKAAVTDEALTMEGIRLHTK